MTTDSSSRITETPVYIALDKEISFQWRWRNITMLFYSMTTVGTIVASSTATILGAMNNGKEAAICAGIATVLISIEKSLLFGEKWRLHTVSTTHLKNVKLDYQTNVIDEKSALERYKKITEKYAAELPIEKIDEDTDKQSQTEQVSSLSKTKNTPST